MIKQQLSFYQIVYYEKEVSQRLVNAVLVDDQELASDCLSDPFVDINFIGDVVLRTRKAEIVLHEECAHEIKFEYEEFRTEANALFLAAQNGNVALVGRLLNAGALVNQRMFRGYATSAAVREGNIDILHMLIDAGAFQPACEEALLEASYFGQAKAAKMLMESSKIRSGVAVHALVTACCRGFVDVVATLIEFGVDVNAIDRVLLQSSKPSLFANIDCNALVAAVVSRQTSVVRLLLKEGVRTDFKVQLGAWSWNFKTGEEFRVGAGLADPYEITWCAVEYFEASGTILRMLLHTQPVKYAFQNGPTLIHHSLVCRNMKALEVLLSFKLNVEHIVKTVPETGVRPLHLASRLGLSKALQQLIDAGCNLNSRTVTEDTALIICARHQNEECLRVLASAGADFGLTNSSNQSPSSIAVSSGWNLIFQQVLLDIIRTGIPIISSNYVVFAPLLFVAKSDDAKALKILIGMADTDINQQDEFGFTAAMLAAIDCQETTLKLLVQAGADLQIINKAGQTARTLWKLHQDGDTFDKIVKDYEKKMQNHHSRVNVTHPLHHAAKSGNVDMVFLLISSKYDVNMLDSDGNTPLMLAAKQDHGKICEILISHGAKCETMNKKGETALSLSKTMNVTGNEATNVLMNEMGKMTVYKETRMKKHRKGGKGTPRIKFVKMVEETWMLKWGKNKKRNAICKEAHLGASDSFRWNRRKKFDMDEPGLFHVVTSKNKTIHFVCDGGNEEAELWVRGIRTVTSEDTFGKNR